MDAADPQAPEPHGATAPVDGGDATIELPVTGAGRRKRRRWGGHGTGARRPLAAARGGPLPFLGGAVLLVLVALGAVAVATVPGRPAGTAPLDPRRAAVVPPLAPGPGTGASPSPTPSASASGSVPPSGPGTRSPAASRPPAGGTATPTAATVPGATATARPAPPAASVPGTPAAASVPGTPAAGGWTSLTVGATKALFRGDSVQTNRTRLLMRQDGDLVIIDENGATRWSSGTAGSGSQAVFQDDGNFVVYDAGNRPLWSSRTDRHDGAVLVLRADGDVCVVYHGASLWCAGTAH